MNKLRYEVVFAAQCTDSDMQCALLVVYTRMEITATQSTSGNFTQSLRFCPLPTDSWQSLACTQQTLSGNLSKELNKDIGKFVFKMSHSSGEVYQIEVTTVIDGTIYYRSLMIKPTKILPKNFPPTLALAPLKPSMCRCRCYFEISSNPPQG
jgi:hypothetical protein